MQITEIPTVNKIKCVRLNSWKPINYFYFVFYSKIGAVANVIPNINHLALAQGDERIEIIIQKRNTSS